MTVRVYLPATPSVLAAVLDAAQVGPAPLRAYTVTPTLREAYAEGGSEELDYSALSEAARASLRLLAAAPGTSPRRVVIAADVPDGTVRLLPDDASPAAVMLSAPVPLSAVAAAHVDDEAAEDDVRAAVDALPAADAGDDDASFLVDGAEGNELLWWATQELADLLAGLSS